jgi:hypothetical protein|tara:strand:- start:1 stop:708 length:708 start_codon:yes stop_codon:yes gene_type:complete
MLKMKDLIKEFATVGGVVTTKPFREAGIGSRKAKSSKLRDIVKDIYGDTEASVDEGAFLEAVGKYNEIGSFIHREGNLKDVATHLSKLAKTARAHTLSETEDWFDKVSVNRNMKELNVLAGSFSKVATEAQSMQERMSALYEDMGHIINRYYDISEVEEASKAYRSHEEEENVEEMDDLDSPESGGKDEYSAFFDKALKDYGEEIGKSVDSPADLDDSEKKEFFNWVQSNWKAAE